MKTASDTEQQSAYQKSWRSRQAERGMHYLTMWVAKGDVAAIKEYAAKRARARKRTQTLETSR